MLRFSQATEKAGLDAAACLVLVHEPPAFDALARVARLCGPKGVPRLPVVVVASKLDVRLRREALQA